MSVGQIRRTQPPPARRISLSSKDPLYKVRFRYSSPVTNSSGAGCGSWSWTPMTWILLTMHIASGSPCILWQICLNVIFPVDVVIVTFWIAAFCSFAQWHAPRTQSAAGILEMWRGMYLWTARAEIRPEVCHIQCTVVASALRIRSLLCAWVASWQRYVLWFMVMICVR